MSNLKIIVVTVLGLISFSAAGQDAIQQKINYYISQAKLDSAKAYIQANLNDVPGKVESSDLDYQLVKVLFMQSDYNEALKHAFQSLDRIGDEQKSVNFNFIIGCIYSAISDYEESVGYFDLVVAHSQDSSLILQTHLLLFQTLLDLNDSTRAVNSLTEAYHLASRPNVDHRTRNQVSIQYYFFNQDYELCKQASLEMIRDSTSFLNSKSYAYSMMGDCLIQQDSLLEATRYFDEFLRLTFETEDPEQIKVAADKLIGVYEKLGDSEKANTYHKIYNEAASDSLSFSIQKYKDLYDTEKNRELSIARSKTQKRLLIFGLVLLLIIPLGAYYYWKYQKDRPLTPVEKPPGKKITISDEQVEKMDRAIEQLTAAQLFLTSNITRKSFCAANEIKSERYLSQYINEKYDRSFSVYINDLRAEYAHGRLTEDATLRSYKIEEVAKVCGFGSKKSFERAFFAKYGVTPYQFVLEVSS